MACCELVKVDLSIIIIQLIAHLIVHLTNQMFVSRIRMQMFKVSIQIQMHLQFHGGIWMCIQMHLHLLTSLLQSPTKKTKQLLYDTCKAPTLYVNFFRLPSVVFYFFFQAK